MRTCMYLRKSRADLDAEARGEGETLAKHKKILMELSKRMSVTVSDIYQEIVSGERIVDRPEMQRLLRDVGDGRWDAVMVVEVERLARGDTMDQGLVAQTFKESETKIVTPIKTYDPTNEFDEEYFEFGLFMSRREYKMITRRLQRGRIGSVNEGNYIGTRPPYGYSIYKDAKGRTLTPNPEQAPAVKLIFDWYAKDQMGSNKIANALQLSPYKTYTGKAWEPSSVLTILKNEVYLGLIQWKKKEQKRSKTAGKRRDTRTRNRDEWITAQGRHEPLVDQETFQIAQERLKKKYHPPYQLVNGLTNPLAGLIRCAKCGASMVYRPYTNQEGHIMCYNRQCDNRSSRYSYVENALIEALGQWIGSLELELSERKNKTKVQVTPGQVRAEGISIMERELLELNTQKSRLHDFLERGIYDFDTFLERSKLLTERIAEAEREIDTIRKHIEADRSSDKAQNEIIPTIKKVIELYPKIDNATDKNELLKEIVDYVEYKKEKHQRDNNFAIELHLKIPR